MTLLKSQESVNTLDLKVYDILFQKTVFLKIGYLVDLHNLSNVMSGNIKRGQLNLQ